jgi:hypothetical protein
MKTILDLISILGFIVISILCLMAAKFGSEWATKMMDTVIPMVITCWITNFTTVINYRYGTSESSQRKTMLISKMIDKADPVIDLKNEVK